RVDHGIQPHVGQEKQQLPQFLRVVRPDGAVRHRLPQDGLHVVGQDLPDHALQQDAHQLGVLQHIGCQHE
ncbi:Ribbon-helix-helix protein, copG family, partial [Dysosmobacter welbionis]